MIPFRIRIRENSYLGDGKHELQTRIVFAHLQIGQSQLLKRKKLLWGHSVYVGALRLPDKSLLSIISPSYTATLIEIMLKDGELSVRDVGEIPACSITLLRLCLAFLKVEVLTWKILTIVDSERLSRLLALLTIALCLAYRTGKWLHEQKPILIKKHGRKAKSIFRYGFDYLPHILLNLRENEINFYHSLQFLSCTYIITIS